jgi:hypothetical protein
MKLTCIILSFALLCTGCYSHTIVPNDTPDVDDVELIFRLRDGSYITSKDGQHHRIVNGFEVTGTHVYERYNNSSKEYSGVLRDDQIEEVIVSELNVTGTVSASLLGGLCVAIMTLVYTR